jgi:UDP-glucose 4-epimerase
MKNKNVIISGGAGFIGSHLFERLGNENSIIIIDNFNDYYSGKEQNIIEVKESLKNPDSLTLIRGNLSDESILRNIDGEIDFIFHLAAQAGVRYSLNNSAEISENNIISTVNLLEFAVKKNIKKFVFASSSSVYGNPLYTPVDESHLKKPISPYAVSKLCGEYYSDYYFREQGLKSTSLRFYTVYGPRGRPEFMVMENN